ncbi:MAG: DUF4091 domain-containing protein [Verrucomicrobia bacterium]|nr:DUF4091 domain-containing protein [Verrucomicrobiota bacterium]
MSPLPVRLPIRVRVLPVTAQPIKHFGTCFGNQHLLASYAKGDTYTEHGIPVADFHGLDRKTRATPAGADALRKLARDYIHRMLDFDIEPHAPTMLAGFTYKVVENPNGGPPKLTDWDFAEFDRSLEMFARRGLRDICVDHSNGDILNTKRLINQVTYSYTPPPKPNAPRWRQLSEDEFWRLVGDYYEQFASHLAAKGWLDGAYILLDESSVASDPVIRRFAQTLRAQPHARQLRLLNTHYHTAIYTSRLNGGHDGPLTMEGVLDVFVPQNNDHYNFWPEDDIWPRDRGPLPKHWVYYTETDHLDLPHAGLSTELMALKCRWLGAQGMLIWGSFVWSMPYKRTDERDWGGGTSGPVMNPWINPNYAHGQGLLSFFYPPDPRGPAKEPTLKITPSYRWALLRDGLQDNALWEIAKAGVDDAGKPVRVPETVRCSLQSQLDATFINPVQWRVSRPHHHAWRDALYRSVQQTKP